MARLVNESQCKCGAVLGIGAPVLPDMWEAHNRICPLGYVCTVEDCGRPATPAGTCIKHLSIAKPDSAHKEHGSQAVAQRATGVRNKTHTYNPTISPTHVAEPMTASEKYLELQTLIELGESPAMAVARLHVNPTNAARWYRRNGYARTAQLMEAMRTIQRELA